MPDGAGSKGEPESHDVVVVGAGFAGLYLLHRLRSAGFDTVVLEAGGGVGGTWYWNRYPGARCDVPSVEYSYSFDPELEQEWEWSERYATQPEILRYLDHVADRFDLRRDIRLDTRVAATTYDESTGRWTVRTEAGDELRARVVVLATGCLSSANVPDFPGRDEYRGAVYHTGRWPHEGVDFTGLRVGVVGTGSSAVQSIPVIAEQAAQVVVFQRTATYSVPAHNGPLDPDEVAEVKARYQELRERNRQSMVGFGAGVPPPAGSALELTEDEIRAELDRRWAHGGLTFLSAFSDSLADPKANEIVAEYVRQRIAEEVRDPEVAAALQPTQVIGCKRMCVDTGYYRTFNQPHVRLVDVSRSPIEGFTPTGLRVGGEELELDAVVLATGFDAMTGAISRIDVRGRGGVALRDEWAAGPRTYLGLAVPRFPNLFLVTGPGSPSVLTNMITSIEQHVAWIGDCLEAMAARGSSTIEATQEAADQWVDYVNTVASFTLFPSCNSWYLGANVPGKPRVFMPLPGFAPYAAQCAQVAADGYTGFALT